MSPLMMELIRDIALLFPALLLVFTFRGFFKAVMAKINGDDTAYITGFVSLNPLNHVDVFGMLTILFCLFLIGGLMPGYFSRVLLYLFLIAVGARWTYPVPINENNFSSRTRGFVLTTLAGPLGNFILALIFMYVKKYAPFATLPNNAGVPLLQMTQTVIDIALFFGVIDLVPLPPFDGGYLLIYFMPPSMLHVARWLEEYALFIMLAFFLLPGLRELFFGTLIFVGMLIQNVLQSLVI